MAETIKSRLEGNVLTLTLASPPVNIITRKMTEEVVTEIESHKFNIMLLEGEGKCFSAGVDIKEHLPDQIEPTLKGFHRLIKKVLALECPVIAKIHGFCLGGGFELAIAADFVIAAEDSKLGFPEVKLAVFPPFACAYAVCSGLPKRIIPMILTGATAPAKDWQTLGLVTDVVPVESLQDKTAATISSLQELSPIGLRFCKKACMAPFSFISKTLDDIEAMYLNDLMKRRDPVEGMKSFMEKRKPQWSGS